MSLRGWLSEPGPGTASGRRLAAARKELARLRALQAAAQAREAAEYDRAWALERAEVCRRLRAGGGCVGQSTAERATRPQPRPAARPAARPAPEREPQRLLALVELVEVFPLAPDEVPPDWVQMEQGPDGTYHRRGA